MPPIALPAPSGTSSSTLRPVGQPPPPATLIPLDLLLHEEILPGGAVWSATVKRGQTLRLTALEAGTNVSLLCFNRHDLTDRYNMADTLKSQHTAKLTTGYILVSDMGRAMLSITGDTLGWHDPLGGHDTAEIVRKKWGEKTYQTARNDWHRNSRDHFRIELAKHGLNTRDLVANVNFFSKVFADTDGRLHFQPEHAKAGDFIDLRAEMDLLVIFTNCQHPLDSAAAYGPKPVKLQLWKSPPPAAADYCRTYRPENERAFYNSEILCH